MPPTLDLTHSTHKMIVSPPRINLRRATSYTHDRGPLSSTSSRFSFNHLVFASPPPSPGLPQLLPRKHKASHTPRPSRVIRAVVYLVGLLSVLYLLVDAVWGASRLSPAHDGLYIWPTERRLKGKSKSRGPSYEMVGQTALPDHPTPVIVTDRHGKPSWTVSIPPNYNTLLTVDDYVNICAKCAAVADKVDELRGGYGLGLGSSLTKKTRRRQQQQQEQQQLTGDGRVHAIDNHFIDVHEAEVAGFLPGSVSVGALLSQQAAAEGAVAGAAESGGLADRPVCGRSLTFMLSASDAGMGRTLMLLWMAYAQAQSEGRGFFIDDSRWAYGRYTDIFTPPPMPGCRPPLRHEMLPCPRQARHLVVSIETASTYFATAGGARKLPLLSALPGLSLSRATPLQDRAAHHFALARRGYEALFRLNDDDAKHVAQRVRHLRAKARPAERGDAESASDSSDNGTIVGLHVRRGDRRPVEFQYRDSYLPLNVYADRAAAAISTAQSKRTKHQDSTPSSSSSSSSSLLVLASDDPMVYMADEFADAARAQERIRLASKLQAPAPAVPEGDQNGAFHKFVDETFGWEGGFFAAMFWNLGEHASYAQAAPSLSPTTAPSASTLRTRSLVGRAYMMDLAVLAQASDVVVCAVSATGCRLLAVMQGWDAAVEQGRWINIDGDYGWWAVEGVDGVVVE